MVAVFMQNNTKNARQKLFLHSAWLFFENHILLKLGAAGMFCTCEKIKSGIIHRENPKSEDTQIFVFSTREAADTAMKKFRSGERVRLRRSLTDSSRHFTF